MKYISILLSLILLTILVSCKKDETVTPGNTSTQNQTNTFIGYLSTYDYMNPSSNQNSNVQISVIGSNDQIISTSTTDSTGKFQITNLPVGTFDFQYTKPGWAKYTTLSVTNSYGPRPTIYSFQSGNPYNNLTYPLVRNIYSDIIDLKLDSIKGGSYYQFTLTLNPDSRDDLSKVNVNVFSTNTILDGANTFLYSPDSTRFIPPNKIYIGSYGYGQWQSNETKSLNTSISSTEDYVQDLLLIKPYEYTNTFKSEGAIKVETFTITKP